MGLGACAVDAAGGRGARRHLRAAARLSGQTAVLRATTQNVSTRRLGVISSFATAVIQGSNMPDMELGRWTRRL